MVLFGSVNEGIFDWPWSGIHLVNGFIIGLFLALLLGRRSKLFWIIGLSALLVWEMFEMTLRYLDTHAHKAIAPLKQKIGGFAFGPETVLNTIGDLIIGPVGLLLGLMIIQRMIRQP